MIVVSVEKALLLLTMYWVVSGVKVQNQFFGRPGKRSYEIVHHGLMYGYGAVTMMPPVLHTAKCGAGSKNLITANGSLQTRIMPHLLMVV